MKLPFQIDLNDKVVVITGAGGLICSAFAEAMAMCGAKVALLDLNEEAAKVNGFNIKKFMFLSFIVSGAIAGIGGSIDLHGAQFRLMSGFGQGFGFDGVAIALIGGLSPIGTVIVANKKAFV